MINYLEINEKKKPARSEDIAGSSGSAQSLWSSFVVGTPDIAMADSVAPGQVVSFLLRENDWWNLHLSVLRTADVLVVDAVAPCEMFHLFPHQYFRRNRHLPVLGATDVAVIDAVAPCQVAGVVASGVDVLAPLRNIEHHTDQGDDCKDRKLLHGKPPLFGCRICNQATIARISVCPKDSIFNISCQAQQKNQHFCCFIV
ncbi:MAG: hypothetical protein A2758_00350 [Candidatus Zambryskibacteria bacterium RIFCSPHIGHO2_01_FULL_49_18]|uniref:Uncharacterized protein n=2 Tax=Candidatus Zambryskiibacteriota TaxID=1817925 RepID=A0A1G2T2P2_9BACT|nr:MAG: hypothetical protein A2758_00350 [Candidatus Zambryskibacteria bacterium RIFCSPHIGHO2_01_FULL_49_18]OHB05669.1 MAG: hypothetical protein A3A26_02185 [Candidatus Zambryskibacteria bacterium RIFCSPLOWO2_01_FULL_47_14]